MSNTKKTSEILKKLEEMDITSENDVDEFLDLLDELDECDCSTTENAEDDDAEPSTHTSEE